MSNFDDARRTSIGLSISGTDLTASLRDKLISLTWTDLEDGEADDLELVLADRDNEINGSWLTKELENRAAANLQGGAKATLTPTITQENWNGGGKDISLSPGKFVLDEIEVGIPPQTVTLRATAMDYSTSARNTAHTQAWENTTLRGIAEQIAARCGYTVLYLSQDSISYGRREQVNQSDIAFLQGLCTAAGLSLKVTGGALVLYSQKSYEGKTTARTIRQGDGSYTTISLKGTLASTCYSACHVTYEDSNTGTTYEATYVPSGYTYDEDNVLEVSNERVSSNGEAKSLAIARLREANKGQLTASLTMPGDLTLVAGLTVNLSGFGGWDGAYYIEQGVHTISGTGGYELELSLRRTITAY